MNDPAIVLFAHGPREPGWARLFERLRKLVAQEVDGESVELAFLETMPPTSRFADASHAAASRGRHNPCFDR